MSKPVPKGEEKVVYKGNILEVVQQDMSIGSKVVTFEWARRSPGTRLVAINSEGKMLLAKEYRREVGGMDYRLPGGKVFDSLSEYNSFLRTGIDILPVATKAIVKEAREEVGLDIHTIEHYYTSKNGATVQWDLYYFISKDFTLLDTTKLEEGEDIESVWVTKDHLLEICKSGEFSEDRSLGVLLRYILDK